MSDEYWLRTKKPTVLRSAVEAFLGELGMRCGSSSSGHISMSYPDADPSVERYGGNVYIQYDNENILMTINGIGGPSDFIDALVQALHGRGVDVEAEET